MKHFFARMAFVSALVVSSIFPSCSQSIPPAPAPTQLARIDNDTLRKAAHQIAMESRTDNRGCSSDAVGPHSLLTAAHCMVGTDIVEVDGTDRHILVSLYDGNDHMLLVVDGAPFSIYLSIEQRTPQPNEHVRVWGWPGDSESPVLREGTFKFTKPLEKWGAVSIWQLPIYGGDSGSGLVSDDGNIIAVLSLGNQSAEACTFPLAFTPGQLQVIR